MRKEWSANSLYDIVTKINYLATSSVPFVFSTVKQSIANFPESMDKESALQQYNEITNLMTED